MAGQLFDVFVVGSADPSPAGETRLATALSSKHGTPLATISKAISAKNLRAGQGLEPSQAQALVRQLQAMGAVTVIRPASGAAKSGSTGSPATPASRASMVASTGLAVAANFGPPLTAPPIPASAGGASRGDASPSDPFAPPKASVTPTPFQTSSGSGARLEPPPLGGTLPKRMRTPPPVSTHTSPIPGTDPFQNDLAAGPRLELARGGQGGPSEDSRLIPRPQAPAGNLRDIGASKASGVAIEDESQNLNLVRCAQHGLYYDKTKASGCRKCMSAAREMAAGFENRTSATKIKVANLRDQPAKRAFIGLATAFILGLLPAAYYAFGPGASQSRELRVRQELLSRQPGTEDVIRQFDDLEEQVTRSRERSMRNIALVWAATSAAAMVGWYKVT